LLPARARHHNPASLHAWLEGQVGQPLRLLDGLDAAQTTRLELLAHRLAIGMRI